jgi:hypothetical protein
MFNPAGAIIQAVMAIYNTVMFFIERGSQIAALAEAVFNSIGTIAAGNVAGAANYVEQTMGRSLPVMISFLARLLGLGGVSEHIKNVIKKMQTPIENVMNKLANFIEDKAKSLLGKGKDDKGNKNEGGTKPQHPSKYVEIKDGKYMLKKEHQNTNPRKGRTLRAKFYGTRYRQATNDWKNEQLATLKGKKSPSGYDGICHPDDPNQYWWKGKWWNNAGTTKATIEHLNPPVLTHWNTDGRNQKQPDRLNFYSEFSNGKCEIMPRSENSSEGGQVEDSYRFEVG